MRDCVVRWGEFRQAPRLLFSAKSYVNLKILTRRGHIQFWNFGHQFGSGCWPACTARVPSRGHRVSARGAGRLCGAWRERLWSQGDRAQTLPPIQADPSRKVLSLRLQVFSSKTGRPAGRESEGEGQGPWWDVRRSGPWRPQPQPDESKVSTEFTEQNSQRGQFLSPLFLGFREFLDFIKVHADVF